MLFLFVFSSEPLLIPDESTQFLNLVLATDLEEARVLALDAQDGRMRKHLCKQIKERDMSLDELFDDYYPFHLCLPIDRAGPVMVASNGLAEISFTTQVPVLK